MIADQWIVVARNGGPVVLGVGDREMFVASDPAALVAHTRSVVHLDDGEIAVVRADGFETLTLDGGAIAKTPSTITWTPDSFDKGEFSHYMRKEIVEQPEAVRRTLSGRVEPRFQTTHLGGIELTAGGNARAPAPTREMRNAGFHRDFAIADLRPNRGFGRALYCR